MPITLSPAGWQIGNTTFIAGELLVQPEPIGSVSINGSSYRGRYRFIPTGANHFDVVNDVDIDSYLFGVVPREMLRDWNPEAYKAQAIVARTYALYEVHTSGGGRPFDLFDDCAARFMAASAPRPQRAAMRLHKLPALSSHTARRATRKFSKRISAPAAAASGNPLTMRSAILISPAGEKNVGALCNASPRFNWGPIVFRKDELTRRIRSWGAKRGRAEKDLGMLVRIDIAAVNRFQRPVRFLLIDSRGLQYSLSGEELRWACNSDANGGQILNSSFVRPISTGDTIQFVEGHGWGHGVGMCQWCAQAMAERGTPHEDIVRFSYPGAVLVRAY